MNLKFFCRNMAIIFSSTAQKPYLSDISVADCTALDPSWQFVVTEPALPVHHGTTLTLNCDVDYTNMGGDTATCQNGQVLTTNPPECHGLSNTNQNFIQ